MTMSERVLLGVFMFSVLVFLIQWARGGISFYNLILSIVIFTGSYLFVNSQLRLNSNVAKLAYQVQRIADKQTGDNTIAREQELRKQEIAAALAEMKKTAKQESK